MCFSSIKFSLCYIVNKTFKTMLDLTKTSHKVALGICASIILVAIILGFYFGMKKEAEAQAPTPAYITFADIDNWGNDYKVDGQSIAHTIDENNANHVAEKLKEYHSNADITNVLVTPDTVYPKDSHGEEYKALSGTNIPSVLYVKASNTEMLDALKAAGQESSGQYFV